MNKKDQIKEIATIVAKNVYCMTDISGTPNARNAARELFDTGYRKQEWISVEERMPEMYEDVLCFNGRSVGIDFICSDGTWCEEVNRVIPVTHWMPLPSPPPKE